MNETLEIFSDYVLLEKIAESHRSFVYRAKQKNKSQTVILKILKRKFNSLSDIARLKQETKLVQNIRHEGIIQNHGIVQHEDLIAIVIEDTEGDSLKNFLKRGSIEISDFFPIAIQLAGTLSSIHSQNIIHKDIKPQNIIVKEKNKKIVSAKITDFGISVILNDEIREIYHPKTIEGTLPYISPEQTGRMNLSIDYRTDLYSLGVTFYEILSGRLPFISNEPLDLIYSHIAKEFEDLHILNPSIPITISKIIQKLMAKSPEDRYQSAYGLKCELEYTYEQFANKKNISDFQVGSLDISDRFVLPQKIFGREKEVTNLLNCYEKVLEGETRIMLVSGLPGIGKSRIVNEVHKPIVKSHGFFISGKYEKLRKDVPFSSIIQAFQNLIRQILSESEIRIEEWKTKILNSIGSNVEIIIKVIPELELIVGKHPQAAELNSEESQNRFNYTFVNFVKVFSRKENPLTLFLDDLQWADQPSLQLLKILTQEQSLKYFFLIISYRDNEVPDSHPFNILIDNFKKENILIEHIHLNSLNSDMVTKFLEHLIGNDTKYIKDIGNILFEKTRGNPFFLNQFIKSMYEEKIVYFSEKDGWVWDYKRILSKEVTENVVDLMAEKILKLSTPLQELFKICACIGNRFNLEQLIPVYEKTYEETLDILNEAIEEGLIYTNEDTYRFLHDRIQEAAYSLLKEEEKNRIHKKIGQLSLLTYSEEEIKEKIFYIADQLNQVARERYISEERAEIIKINLIAGKRALGSAAYQSALHYLLNAKALIDWEINPWINQYQLTYDIFIHTAEASYLCQKYEEMDNLLEVILKKSVSIADKIQVYEIKIKMLIATHDLKGAVETGLNILKQLKIRFPKKPKQIHALFALIHAKFQLSLKKNNIQVIKTMNDLKILSAIRIISSINSAAYWANPDLLPLLILKVVNLSLQKGNSQYSPYNYAGLGLILSSLNFFQFAEKIGLSAISLAEKFNAVGQKPRTYFVYNTFIRPWVNHIRSSLIPLSESYLNALHVGDIEFASHSAFVYSYYYFLSGNPLDDTKKEVEKYAGASVNLKQKADYQVLANYQQIISILFGEEAFTGKVEGKYFNEDSMLKSYISQNDRTSLFHLYLNGLTLNFLFGDIQKAISYGNKNQKTLDGGLSVFALIVFYFYDSLSRLALLQKDNFSYFEKLKQTRIIKKNLSKIRSCEKINPENFSNKVSLIEAEIAQMAGNVGKAIFLYEKAIQDSRKNLFLQDEALAYELAGKFYLKFNLKDNAKMCLSQSRICYNKWGAFGLLKNFDSIYSNTLPKYDKDSIGIASIDSIQSQSLSIDLDFSTIMKFSHVLSSEIELNVLLEKIIAISMENAGAQKGHLILEKNGKLYIEASAYSKKNSSELKSVLLEEFTDIPKTIVNYVWKTKESVILPNAKESEMFVQDPYIALHKLRSVLCIPILYKRSMSGILYLENNLSTNTFTKERIELLSVLSTQAAISIDNARLIAKRQDSAKLEKEMEITSNIQLSLLPENPNSEGYEISSYMKPSESVGGDYYDIIHGNEKDWLVIGDVSGHGILSGLVMMMVQTSIHLLLSKKENYTPADILKNLILGIEDNIQKISKNEYKYMTITVMNFDKTGVFHFSGHHQDILIYRKMTKTVERLETEGIWIGLGKLAQDKVGLIPNKEFFMNSGDTLLVYTDGITEGVYKDGREFGVEGLEKILQNHGDKFPDEIHSILLKKIDEIQISDDISFLVLKKT
ncbi:MAG: AAA family ATPase [Leptospiraceae bacterium]|nr:AAA family ATPase [Leptospiraceae bacterium]MCK6381636.1 AAA family ATPase [Leptospiraceae bacterium]NUM41306.1 AAA family ATPase [Leptospiraceae bacterium]